MNIEELNAAFYTFRSEDGSYPVSPRGSYQKVRGKERAISAAKSWGAVALVGLSEDGIITGEASLNPTAAVGPLAEIAVILANRELGHHYRYLGVVKGQVPATDDYLMVLATKRAQAWQEAGFATAAEVSAWMDADCYDPEGAKFLRGVGVTPVEACCETVRGVGGTPGTVGAKACRGALPLPVLEAVIGWHRQQTVDLEEIYAEMMKKTAGVPDKAYWSEEDDYVRRIVTRRYPHEPLILFAGKTGYSVAMLFAPESTSLPANGERATCQSSSQSRKDIVTSAQKMVDSMLKTDKNERFLYFDGRQVIEVPKEKVSEVVRAHIKRVLQTWKNGVQASREPVVAAYLPSGPEPASTSASLGAP